MSINHLENHDKLLRLFKGRSMFLTVNDLWITVPGEFSLNTVGLLYFEKGQLLMSFIISDDVCRRSILYEWVTARGMIDSCFLVDFPKLMISGENIRNGVNKNIATVYKLKDEEEYPFNSAMSNFEAKYDSKSLRYKNETTTVTESNPYFRHDGRSSNLDSWTGFYLNYHYLFRLKDENIEAFIHVTHAESEDMVEISNSIFENIILSFSWLNGSDPYHWYRKKNIQSNIAERELCNKFGITDKRPSPIAYNLNNDERPNIIISLMTEYLTNGGACVQVKEAMWHFRSATASRHLERTNILGLSSIIEGLINSVLQYQFNIPRKRVFQLGCGPFNNVTGKGRKRNRRGPIKARFKFLCRRLNIPWTDQAEHLYITWKEVRNSLAHGDFSTPYHSGMENIFEHEQHLTHLFNMILIRLIGYEGELTIVPQRGHTGCVS